jgi:biotin operon repressor
MKFSGWTESQALEEMERWWKEACEKGGPKPFTLKDTLYRVRRTYKISRLKGPKAETVRRLTGIDFYYDRVRFSTPRKARKERKYSYQVEWKNDLLTLLESNKGVVIASMEKIATQLGCAVSSLKNVLQTMQQEGLIDVHTKRGRNGSTTIQLLESVKIETAEKADIAEEKNSQINNTIGEEVGGGFLFLESFTSVLSLLQRPYSVDFIDFIQLLHTYVVAPWFLSSSLSDRVMGYYNHWILVSSLRLSIQAAEELSRGGLFPSLREDLTFVVEHLIVHSSRDFLPRL